MTFIDSPEEIDSILPEVAAKKSGESMLKDTGSWDDTANDIVKTVKESMGAF